ncbi:hypothetical protein GON01_05155 [Sphingomonas sp. MAH-20]|jgi:hypothetical protein|uniref:Uncharacterized protein n=1 Tax=Sphingomonas horti TaxID=2682842 RepID=A0A6I4IYU5_9SPHN|nr:MULTISPECIES: hypothetical protein [Sphingomonas]MBA2918358.1 hypothetical protein [Sphingomonas sp. CGMCC 1.13658]MVO77325.1 hypothetical protein [Sphingomonas horti]
MHDDDVSVGEVKRRQQLLRDHIAENDRLIGEAAQRVATSRAITGAAEAAPDDDAQATSPDSAAA